MLQLVTSMFTIPQVNICKAVMPNLYSGAY